MNRICLTLLGTIGPVKIAPSGSGFNLDGNHCNRTTLGRGKRCVVSLVFMSAGSEAASAVVTYKAHSAQRHGYDAHELN